MHLTSTGKLFLALDDPQRVRAYATRTGLPGHTRNSITQLPVLERELAKARQYGLARDNEELELGVRCMAAGVYDDQGKLVAGLSISAPADRLDESWLPKLQATASGSFQLLVDAVEAPDRPAAQREALRIWASLHGIVMLHNQGLLKDRLAPIRLEQLVEDVLPADRGRPASH